MSKPASKKRANKTKSRKRKAVGPRAAQGKTAVSSTEAAAREPDVYVVRSWTDEARREAVALLERGDASIAQIAAELGVSTRSLQKWKLEFEQEESDTPMTAEERRQFTRLRKENERLRMECEILKKAATFFARHRS